MDKLTEVRQSLGRRIFALMQKYDASAHLELDGLNFYSHSEGSDAKYVFELGWTFSNGDGLFAVRKGSFGVQDAVSARTKLEDLQRALKLMPVVEKYFEVTAEEVPNV